MCMTLYTATNHLHDSKQLELNVQASANHIWHEGGEVKMVIVSSDSFQM